MFKPHHSQTQSPARQAEAANSCSRESAGTRAGADGFPLVYTQDIRPSSNGAGSQPFQIIEVPHWKTGEVVEFEWSGQQGFIAPRYTITQHQNTRLDRYALKWAVDRLLPESRQTRCHRWKIPGRNLDVKLSLEHQKSFYSGFECCGSVWGCPICAPKIAERRRAELSSAIETAKKLGYQVLLGTYTIPHGLGDDLKVIRKQLCDVWGKWGTDMKAGKRMRREIGLVGYFRAFEVTYGKNGWHPHFHALLILDTDLTPYEIQKAWYPVWLHGCRKAGLGDPNENHGVRISDGKKAAWYVNKWGMESEITKGHLKKGKKSVNPWDLLRVYTFGLDNGRISSDLRNVFEDLGIDESRSGALWLDFFKGFKGQRQIRPSNGIRALLGLTKEKSDQELAEQEMDPVAALLATLTDDERKDLIFAKKLPDLLNLAEDNPGLIPEYLDVVRREYREKRLEAEKKRRERLAAPGAQRSGRRPRRERR